jgi:hypothetical protein
VAAATERGDDRASQKTRAARDEDSHADKYSESSIQNPESRTGSARSGAAAGERRFPHSVFPF